MLGNTKAENGREWCTALILFPAKVTAFGKEKVMNVELELSLEDMVLEWSLWHVAPEEQDNWKAKSTPIREGLLEYALSSTCEHPPFPVTGLNQLFCKEEILGPNARGMYEVEKESFAAVANSYIEWLAQVFSKNFEITAQSLLDGSVLTSTVQFKSRGGSVSSVSFKTYFSAEQRASFQKAMA